MVKITLKKRTLGNIGLIFLGIFLGLLFLEIGLRIGGFVFLAMQRQGNIITNETDAYRILALGESTTANLRNLQSSWPEELEIILNNRGSNIKFMVFNEGIPGITTPEILLNLKGNLDKYNPDMVIVMMGTNDLGLYIKRDSLRGKLKLFIGDFRVYKLFKRIIEGLKYNLDKEDIQEDLDEKDILEEIQESRLTEQEYEEEKRLKKAVENNPLSAGALIELEKFYLSHEKFKELESVAKKHVEIYPNDLKALYNLGVAYGRLGKYQESEEIFKKVIEINPNHYDALYNLGEVSNKLGKYQESEEIFKKALDIAPYNSTAHIYSIAKLGMIYERLNRQEEAIEAYEYILLYKLEDDKYDESVLIRLASMYIDENSLKDAYALLEIIISINSNKIEEVFWMGDIYQELNKTDDTIKLFRKTILINPDNYAAYTELALYYLKNNRFEEAEEMIKKSMEINPNDPEPYTKLAEFYLNKNMLEEAEELFNKAMKINPSFLIMIYDNLGTRYQKKGQFEKADEIINKASELRRNYYNPATQENYRELYNVVSKRGIKLIVMQYPTLDVDDLKKMFKGDEEIIFISNEENFNKALENAAYEELFTDYSRGSFGHAKLKGNRLIAENVANAISDVGS